MLMGTTTILLLFKALGKELKGIQRPAHYLAIPPTMFEEQLEYCGCTRMLGPSSRIRLEAGSEPAYS
jgi:hypothetical protein